MTTIETTAMTATPEIEALAALGSLGSRIRDAREAANAEAQLSTGHRESQQGRQRSVDHASIMVGIVGIACLVAALCPGVDAAGLSRMLVVSGLILGATPVLALAFRPNGDGHAHQTSAQAASATVMANRLAEALGIGVDGDDVGERLAKCLAELVTGAEADVRRLSALNRRVEMGARRRGVRVRPRNTRVEVTTRGGHKLIGIVADVSITGVALQEPLPHHAEGDRVSVGSRPAIVTRVWEKGIAFRFDEEVDPDELNEDIVL